MAFAPSCQARLPVGSLAGDRLSTRQTSLHAADWWVAPSSQRARPRASTPRSPRTPAGCYKGGLVPPSAGLAPASRRELQDAMALTLGASRTWRGRRGRPQCSSNRMRIRSHLGKSGRLKENLTAPISGDETREIASGAGGRALGGSPRSVWETCAPARAIARPVIGPARSQPLYVFRTGLPRRFSKRDSNLIRRR